LPGERVVEICFKVYQVRNGSRVAKKKTLSKRDDNNLTFNEAMIFSVSQQTLEACDGFRALYNATKDTIRNMK